MDVIHIDIDEEINLDEDRIQGMPDDIKGNLLATMTQACKNLNCHWTDLVWNVKMIDRQPIIYVNKK